MPSKNRTSVEKIRSLVKADLGYDGESWRMPQGYNNVIGTHGTRTDSIARLALHGRFVGPSPDLGEEFYITPNFRYGKWEDTDLAEDARLFATVAEDALKEAIDYSESYDAADYLGGDPTQGKKNHGVVILFNKRALLQGSKFFVPGGGIGNVELVLPNAPPVTSIQGIYPVDAEASEALEKELQSIPA